MTDRSKGKRNSQRYELSALLDSVLRSSGRTIPVSEDEVRLAEVEVAALNLELPEQLADPYRLLSEDLPRSMPTATVINEDPTITQELARAAREGSVIPPSVEAAMQRDREAAERASRAGSDES